MAETIYESDFAKCLPNPLTHDKKIVALASAVSKELLDVSRLSKMALIYPRIDELPEELLDVLAHDLHVDWYDYGYDAETKRNVLKGSVGVHRKMGTKRAVEKAVSDVYGTATVEEWFDYGGEPYHFKIAVGVGEAGVSEYDENKLLEKMRFYKNLRSRCDGIFYGVRMKTAKAKAAAVQKVGMALKVNPLLPEGAGARGSALAYGWVREEGSITIKHGTES